MILDLCGGTGSWSKPWKDAGYEVLNVTLPKYDVRDFVTSQSIYGVLAAPVCTVFAVSGARWERTDEEIDNAWELVEACLYIIEKANPVFWVLEQPITKLVRYLGKPKMYFQPCDFGDTYTKKTCLWGNFKEPQKDPVIPVQGSKMHLKYGGKSARTKEMRSITPEGFARAFFEANKRK